MPMPGGQVWVIGWATVAGLPVIGAPSIKLAPLCGVLDLSLAAIGKSTAALEKSRTISRLHRGKFTPMRAGLAGAIGLAMTAASATGALSRMRDPLRGASGSNLPRHGWPI